MEMPQNVYFLLQRLGLERWCSLEARYTPFRNVIQDRGVYTANLNTVVVLRVSQWCPAFVISLLLISRGLPWSRNKQHDKRRTKKEVFLFLKIFLLQADDASLFSSMSSLFSFSFSFVHFIIVIIQFFFLSLLLMLLSLRWTFAERTSVIKIDYLFEQSL